MLCPLQIVKQEVPYKSAEDAKCSEMHRLGHPLSPSKKKLCLFKYDVAIDYLYNMSF